MPTKKVKSKTTDTDKVRIEKEIISLKENISKLEELNNRLKYILEDIRFQRRR